MQYNILMLFWDYDQMSTIGFKLLFISAAYILKMFKDPQLLHDSIRNAILNKKDRDDFTSDNGFVNI